MDPVLADAVTRELRAFVAAAGTTRALPTTVHVGHPGGERVALADVPGAGLRADLVTRSLDGLLVLEGACVWLTRGGRPGIGDVDAGWWAAARQGFARHGLVLPAFVVLTRTAWQDHVSGEQRSWSRVRPTGAR